MIAQGVVLPAQTSTPAARRMEAGIQLQGHRGRIGDLMEQLRLQLLRGEANPYTLSALRIEAGHMDTLLRELGQPQGSQNGARQQNVGSAADHWDEPLEEPAVHRQTEEFPLGRIVSVDGTVRSVTSVASMYQHLAGPLSEGALDVPLTC
jgi:hypothetical protein